MYLDRCLLHPFCAQDTSQTPAPKNCLVSPDAESRPTAPLPSRAPFSSPVTIKCPICAALHPLTTAMKLLGGLRLSGPTLSTISAEETAVCRDANHATQPFRPVSRLHAIEGCAWDRSFRLLTETSYSHLTGQDLYLAIAAASRIRLQHDHIQAEHA